MAQLAINGGGKAIGRPLGKPWPIYDETEEKALLEVLHSGKWWRGGYREDEGKGSKVGAFEEAFAAYQDAKYGVAVTNGTTALECALLSVGVDEPPSQYSFKFWRAYSQFCRTLAADCCVAM